MKTKISGLKINKYLTLAITDVILKIMQREQGRERERERERER